MSLTANDITAKNFQTFYEGIRPYLNGSFPTPIVNKFSKGDLYSTDEKIIGQWIDGKPLYKRTFELPSAISVGDITVTRVTSIDGSNIDRAFGCIGLSQSSDFSSPLLVTCESSDTDIGVKSLGGTLSIKYIVLSYTKTTDTPISIGEDTDYSTEEKIVGTWIDGKPLYLRVFTGLSIKLNWEGQYQTNATTTPLLDEVDSIILANALGEEASKETVIPLRIRMDSSSSWKLCSIDTDTITTIILLYTKTTDA